MTGIDDARGSESGRDGADPEITDSTHVGFENFTISQLSQPIQHDWHFDIYLFTNV